jgi:enoyl-CoA hydratase/carnithine racemase
MDNGVKAEGLRIERLEGHVVLVTIDRPDARNAIDGAVTMALDQAVRDIEADDLLWVAILTGAGGGFCAGADLKAVAKGEGRSLATREGGFAGFTSAKRTKPWIAAVEGNALAGGLELALACDFVIAGETAKFGLPEAKRGMLAAAGGAYRLPRLLPRAIAMEMIATGAAIDAAWAAQFGLINRLVPAGEAVAAARDFAAEIARSAPLAVREGLALARATFDHDDVALARMTHEANKRLFATEDFKEGPRAFIEKRLPRWSGR